MNKVYQKKHDLWLAILFSSFAISDEAIKSRLYDFSMIAFRHLKWLAEDILQSGDDYNYERGFELYKHETTFGVLEALKKQTQQIQQHYPNSVLGERLKTDDAYLMHYLDQILSNKQNDQAITAFDMKREWENLDQESIDALTLFLFEESYKEYELILIYAYMQARTDDKVQFDVYQDLIDESHFHLKSFGNMMAKLGILALPRELHEMTYKIKDLSKFIKDGIAEEEAAKEMCKELSANIKDDKLAKFFDFINFQESYHIELMKKLL
ncbi:MAG: iron-binding protein [Epsilonproteobacteria bacterium]|nr:iron-binding protein [Campylobacterota bacterium]